MHYFFVQRLFFLVIVAFLLPGNLPADSPDAKTRIESEAEIVSKSIQRQYAALWEGMSQQAKAGYRNLVENVYLPSDFDESVLHELDAVEHEWPLRDDPLHSGQRESTWKAYGLAPRPDDPSKPLQYVVTEDQRYVMNCFACHGGNLFGATYPGAPNTTYALETLTDQVRRIKISLKKPLGHMDVGSMFMPLGRTVGSSNAVMFGVALMNFRDEDLNVHVDRIPAEMEHHDMDAPPWWHFHRKHHIYIDGFAQKGHRGLMQFMLVRQNGPEKFKAWEEDFREVYAFLSELRPPKYPLPVDPSKSQRGAEIFQANCASCHGTYGNDSEYPELRIAIDDIGTDRVRLEALSSEHRMHYGKTWFGHHGEQLTLADVDGYVAPPLDGLWASAPYFHNGSVPTLWDVLYPDDRPIIWRRTQRGLDNEKMGLKVESFEKLPRIVKPAERRWYFDTQQPGKSAKGHDYPNALSESDKSDLLEYLKTL